MDYNRRLQLWFGFLLILFFTTCKNETPQKVISTADTLAMELDTASTVIQIEKIKPALVFDYDTTQWTEIKNLDSTILIDLKYAGEDNFVEEKMYDCARCFLRPQAAKALVKLHKEFQEQGYGLKLYDCYRPLPIQQKLWDKIPNPSYVMNPKKGSMHNRGLAVDLTLVDEAGVEVDMGTPFDFFGRKAHHTHTDLPKEVLTHRRLLKSTMEGAGFKSIRTEWWHYSYRYAKYPLADMEWNCE